MVNTVTFMSAACVAGHIMLVMLIMVLLMMLKVTVIMLIMLAMVMCVLHGCILSYFLTLYPTSASSDIRQMAQIADNYCSYYPDVPTQSTFTYGQQKPAI
jgi:hypothetical protein